MDDGVAAAHVGFEGVDRPEDVTLDALDGAEAVKIRLGAAADEAADGMPLRTQGLHDRPPHEPRRSGDEDPVHRFVSYQACGGRMLRSPP